MGAAAAVYARIDPPVDALICESVYPDLRRAVRDRLANRLGAWAACLAPLLTAQFAWRTGFELNEMEPVRRVGELRMPKFFIAGQEDRHTTIAESREIFAAAAGPKMLWEVPGAVHVDFHFVASVEYERRVLRFLNDALGPPGT